MARGALSGSKRKWNTTLACVGGLRYGDSSPLEIEA